MDGMSMDNDSVDISQLRAEALTFHELSKGAGVFTCNAPDVDKLDTTTLEDRKPSYPRAGRYGEDNSHAELNARAPPNVSKSPRMSGGSNPSGDTQPLSQWVYDEYTNRNRGQDRAVENSTRDTGTHHTLHTGQPGHFNLLEAFNPRDLSDGEGSDGGHEDAIAGTTQPEVRTELFPEHRRFHVPKTPATDGKKRNYMGEVLKSGGTTPVLPVNPFGFDARENTGAMGLSQVFRATQAGTSPVANLQPSDVPSTRPSPAFNHHRPSTTGSLSSPAIMRHTGIQRATTEPHSRYVSMQESQAERRKRQQGQSTSSPIDKKACEWGISDDELDPIEQKAQNREKQRRREAEAKKQFAIMAEALVSRTNATPGQPRLARQREPSSPTLRKANGTPLPNFPVEQTIDLTSDNLTEDETEHEDDLDEPEQHLSDDLDELVDDDKENAGRRQVQIVTPRSKRGGPRAIVAYPSPESRRQAPSPILPEEFDELDADAFPQPLSQPRLPVTIADSQSSQKLPSQRQRQLSQSDQPQERISSPTSRTIIPQSQAVLHTSQLDSSMKRHLSEPSPLFKAPRPISHGSPNSKGLSPQNQNTAAQNSVETPRQEVITAYGSSPPVVMEAPVLPAAKGIATGLEERQDPKENLQLVQEHASSPMHVLEKSNSRSTTNITPSGPSTTHLATLRSTIPETRSVVRQVVHPSDSNQLVVHHEGIAEKDQQFPTPSRETDSKVSTEFETAHTHLATSPPKASKQYTSQMSKGSGSPASPSFTRIRKFNDIAAEPTPPDEELDMDMDINLITSEDIEFQSLMDASSPIGPATKRRRRTYGRRTGSDVRGSNLASGEVASSAAPEETDAAQPATKLPELAAMDSRAGQVAEQRDPIGNGNTSFKSTASANKQTEEFVTQIHHPPLIDEERLPSNPNINRASLSSGLSNYKVASHEEIRPSTNTIASRRLKRKSREFDSDKDVDELAQPEAHTGLTLPSREKAPVSENIGQHLPPPASAIPTKMLAPTRVLAHFNSSVPKFYPATCLYLLKGEPERFKVRFDDGTTADLHPSHVKRYELRHGDLVKLDRPDMAAQTWVVQSVHSDEGTAPPSPNPTTPSKRRRLLTDGTNKYLKTDIFGNSRVTVSLKQKDGKSTKLETVPMDAIYLPQSLFKKLKDRAYTHPASPSNANPLQTPSELSSAPSTPASRSRRNRASHSSFSAPSSASKVSHLSSGLFGNMLFSMTNIPDQRIRASLMKSISSNGGIVLDTPDGFRELFNEDASPTPGEFVLTPRAQGKGFTALLADKHCRNAKYIQALALGIPCLSPRWINDCLTADELLPWEPYLLASGESSFLHGAVRSRLLPSYGPETATLQSVISSRPHFLQDQTVLLIIGTSADIMKNYPLIARALGATKVETAKNAEEGRERLAGERFDWVYFHEGETRDREKKGGAGERDKKLGVEKKINVEDIEGVLFGRGKKRKRGSKGEEEVQRGGTRVVTTEFVVQSLILGRLLPGK